MAAALRDFLAEMTRLVSAPPHAEDPFINRAKTALNHLVARDDWLPEPFAAADSEHYRQYLLFCDPLARFSVVSFVWGPGQATPIHDHTVWGLVGMLRGREGSQRFTWNAEPATLTGGEIIYLEPGEVEILLPSRGDIHRVWNDVENEPSISVHVYGGDIGAIRRHTYTPGEAHPRDFVSGYSNTVLPNCFGPTS